jgi:hypothetical protein
LNYPLLTAKEKDGFSVNGFFNTGVFIVSAWSGDVANPVMYVVQPGAEVKYKDFSSKAAVAYYGFQNDKGKTLTWSAGSNTLTAGGVLKYHYSSVGLNGELGLATPLKPLDVDFIHYAGLLGEYIYNPDPPKDNQGFLAGFKIGDKSVSERNTWQLVYIFKYLERNAFLDAFPDSDFLKGMTNGKGHIVSLQYAPLKHVIFAITNYYMYPIKDLLTPIYGQKRPVEDLFFFDTIFTF